MIKTLTLCLLLALGQSLFAQTFSSDIWHKGKVVVTGWDTLKGLVRYNQENFVELMRDGKVEIHDSQKVVSFEIQDQSYKRLRQFYSLRYGEAADKKYYFFELISYGKLTVLSREAVEVKTLSQGSVMAPPKKHRVLAERYFLWDKHESVVNFRGRKNDWLEQFGTRMNYVQDYVKNNKLDFGNKYELKQIIDFYNALFNP